MPDQGGSTLSVRPEGDSEFHLSNLEIERVFFQGRNLYFDQLPVEDLWRRRVTPQIRESLTRFEREVEVGTPLKCSSHVVSRSNRAFVMEQELCDHASNLVATCRSVHVSVDAEAGAAVALPNWLWSAVLEMEPALDA
jgi:acyl-CoA thioesterase FadM